MLDEEDRQRLAAIERQILTEDPAFAHRLAGRPARSIARMAGSAFIGIVCALATLLGVYADSGVLFLGGALLTIEAGWAFWLTARRGWSPAGRRSGPP